MENIKNEMLDAMKKATIEYISVYGTGDNGTCGYAFGVVALGRKRKLKQQLIDGGIIDSEATEWYGKRVHMVRRWRWMADDELLAMAPCTQNMNYPDEMAMAQCKVLNKHFPELDFYTLSYMD